MKYVKNIGIGLLIAIGTTAVGQEHEQTIGVSLAAGSSYGLVNSSSVNSTYYGKIANSVLTYRVGLLTNYRISKLLEFGFSLEFEKLGDVSDYFPYDPYRGFGERSYKTELYNLNLPLKIGIYPLKFMRLELGFVNSVRLKSQTKINFGPEFGWDKTTGGEFTKYNIGGDLGIFLVLRKGNFAYNFGISQRNYWIKEADGMSIILDEFPPRFFSSTTFNLSIHFLM